MPIQLTRRSALVAISGTTLGLLGASALALPARSGAHRRALMINSLGEPDDGYAPKQSTGGADPFISNAGLDAAIASGICAFNYTIAAGTSFKETMAAIDKGDAFIAQHPDRVLKILGAADILRARDENKIGIIYGFQNAAMVEDKASNVDVFADRGVRIIQLTYNALNQLGGGSLVPGNVGLTPFGQSVVDRLNARRVIVDLSHSGRAICLDAARYSRQPVCISHTACRAVADTPRNKTDEELRLVAEKGGYVGIYFMPFIAPGREFSSEDVANHIDHAVRICGEDHVGIGSDHGVNPLGDMDKVRAHYADMVIARQKQGISAPGEDPKLLPYGSDLIGPDQFRTMAATLRKRGYSQRRVDKIMGGNFLRYARSIWGA